jgi:hypothetical protein
MVKGVAPKSVVPVRLPEPRSPANAPVASRTARLPVLVTTVVDWFGGKIL